jgi:hypothetical protein
MFNKVHLIVCYYYEKNDFRRSEIVEAIKRNLQNHKINAVTILLENAELSDNVIDAQSKVTIYKLKDRAKFCELFNYFKPNHTNIIANNDIVIKLNTVANLKLLLFRDACLTLTRYELNGKLFRETIGDSQDTWIFGPKIVKEKLIELKIGNYYMGLLGCDNRLLYELFFKGIKVFNLPWDFITLHNHSSNVRNYTEMDRLSGDYMTLMPIRIKSFIFVRFFFQKQDKNFLNYLEKKGFIKVLRRNK